MFIYSLTVANGKLMVIWSDCGTLADVSTGFQFLHRKGEHVEICSMNSYSLVVADRGINNGY